MKHILKTVISTIAFFISCLPLQAQTLSPQVIASGGTSVTNAAGTLQYTIGQPVDITVNNGTNILTQGFQQPEQNLGINVKIKVFLQGAYLSGVMNTALRTANLLPLNQPYNATPWNYAGTESVATASSIPANAVDWVLVELRSSNVGTTPLSSQAGFLLSDGSVVNTQGIAGLNFNVPIGNYYIVVRHRNHVAIMSASGTALPNTAPYDFSTAATQAYGANQQAMLSTGVYGLFVGDMNANGIIDVADYNIYGASPSGINVYQAQDLDLDKIISVADYNKYLPNASRIGVPQIRY